VVQQFSAVFYEDGAIRARDDLGYAPSCSNVVACGCCCHFLSMMMYRCCDGICQAAPRKIDRSLLLRHAGENTAIVEWTYRAVESSPVMPWVSTNAFSGSSTKVSKALQAVRSSLKSRPKEYSVLEHIV
jgi:hypothetical protein